MKSLILALTALTLVSQTASAGAKYPDYILCSTGDSLSGVEVRKDFEHPGQLFIDVEGMDEKVVRYSVEYGDGGDVEKAFGGQQVNLMGTSPESNPFGGSFNHAVLLSLQLGKSSKLGMDGNVYSLSCRIFDGG
jgi:hypothetical protein